MNEKLLSDQVEEIASLINQLQEAMECGKSYVGSYFVQTKITLYLWEIYSSLLTRQKASKVVYNKS